MLYLLKINSSTKDLSRCISSSISNKLEIRNRGHKEANFAVLRLSNMSAVLIEVAFISNKDDANKLNSKQDEFAQCIATPNRLILEDVAKCKLYKVIKP